MRVTARNTVFAVIACLFGGQAIAAGLDGPIQIQGGQISGAQTAPGIVAFKGIPFAAPPVGDLRWREPQAPLPWTVVRKATQIAPACEQNPQTPILVPTGVSEDCLYLNVWTPASAKSAKLPVMVWIYGGGLQRGSTARPSYDGNNLAKKGAVLVSISYRTGVLGFMAHPELTAESSHHASGNYGILDQIAALSWIKKNIAAFGGDPGNVTLFGESAGSTSINILQASPLAKGLFKRVIGESTSEMDAAAGLNGRRSFAQAEQAGLAYQTTMGAHSLAELRAMPADKIAGSPTPFWAIEQDHYVLPETVYKIFATGQQNPADLLTGANEEEGAVLRTNWIKPQGQAEQDAFTQLYGQENPVNRKSDTDAVLWQMWSWADLNAKVPGHQTYFYWFSESPPPNPDDLPRPAGPVHGAEIIYVFNNLNDGAAWTKADWRVADTMSSYWTNFAKTGNPNGPGLPDWPLYTAKDPQVMGFSPTTGSMAMPHPAAVKFIDGYFAKRRQEAGQTP